MAKHIHSKYYASLLYTLKKMPVDAEKVIWLKIKEYAT